MGITEALLIKLEAGDGKIILTLLKKLAKGLNVSLDTLVHGLDIKKAADLTVQEKVKFTHIANAEPRAYSQNTSYHLWGVMIFEYYYNLKRSMRLLFSILFVLSSFQLFSQDTIVVHIAHGSKPRSQYKDEFRTIGGKKGGHVVIQIDQFVYGFYFRGSRIHIFPHKMSKNSIFQKQSLQEWTNITKDKKVTKFFIPVTKEEKIKLLMFYTENIKTPAYDYAFFGQRCASSAYEQLKSVNKIHGGNYFFNAFYPAQLRKKLIRQAHSKNYHISVKAGSIKRIWEGD